MEITAFGVIWIPISMFALLLPIRASAALVVFASIFHAAAVVNLAQKGVSPFVVSEVTFIVRCALLPLRVPSRPPVWLVLAFILDIFSVGTALSLPFVFSGITIYVPDKGMDYAFLYGGSPLKFGVGNIAQCVYFTLNVGTLCLFYFNSKRIGGIRIFKWFVAALLTTTIFGFWKIASNYGYLPFPDDFLYSNIGLSQQYGQVVEGLNRVNSTFTEASYFGGVMAAAFFALLSMGKKYAFAVLLVLTMLVSSFSGAGAGAVAFGAAIYLAVMGARRAALVLFVVALSIIFLYWAGLGELFDVLIVNKLSSGSAQVRGAADIFTLNLIINTYGLGVGLGSHRTSSLALNLLGNIGCFGFFIFVLFFYKTVISALKEAELDSQGFKERRAVSLFLLVLISAQFIALPDVNFFPFWAGLFVLVALRADVSVSRSREVNNG